MSTPPGGAATGSEDCWHRDELADYWCTSEGVRPGGWTAAHAPKCRCNGGYASAGAAYRLLQTPEDTELRPVHAGFSYEANDGYPHLKKHIQGGFGSPYPGGDVLDQLDQSWQAGKVRVILKDRERGVLLWLLEDQELKSLFRTSKVTCVSKTCLLTSTACKKGCSRDAGMRAPEPVLKTAHESAMLKFRPDEVMFSSIGAVGPTGAPWALVDFVQQSDTKLRGRKFSVEAEPKPYWWDQKRKTRDQEPWVRVAIDVASALGVKSPEILRVTLRLADHADALRDNEKAKREFLQTHAVLCERVGWPQWVPP